MNNVWGGGLQAQCSSLGEQGATLAEEKGQLKNALVMALEHSAGLEAALGSAHRDAEAQRSQASRGCLVRKRSAGPVHSCLSIHAGCAE